MATKYECDRCKTQFVSSQDIARIEFPAMSRDGFTHDDGYTKDVCITCARDISEFASKLPKGMVVP